MTFRCHPAAIIKKQLTTLLYNLYYFDNGDRRMPKRHVLEFIFLLKCVSTSSFNQKNTILRKKIVVATALISSVQCNSLAFQAKYTVDAVTFLIYF